MLRTSEAKLKQTTVYTDMKEGNYSPCQMANKRSISLYILDTRYKKRAGLITSITSEVRQHRTCRLAMTQSAVLQLLTRAGFQQTSMNCSKCSWQTAKGQESPLLLKALNVPASRLGLLFINVIFHVVILCRYITNIIFTTIFGMAEVSLQSECCQPCWSCAGDLRGN